MSAPGATVDYVLSELNGRRWPGILSWRGRSSLRGYATAAAARARRQAVVASWGRLGRDEEPPDLRVLKRVRSGAGVGSLRTARVEPIL